MGRIGVAFRAFFQSLASGETAARVERALRAAALPAPETEEQPAEKRPAAPPPPARSDALTLLSALQREARFVDFVMEPLDSYSDQQVGAAARDVHRGCRETVERMFAIEPLLEQDEGEAVEVPSPLDPDRFRLVGNVAGDPPYRGQLTHRGWTASRLQLPAWKGSRDSSQVVAPAEVELS